LNDRDKSPTEKFEGKPGGDDSFVGADTCIKTRKSYTTEEGKDEWWHSKRGAHRRSKNGLTTTAGKPGEDPIVKNRVVRVGGPRTRSKFKGAAETRPASRVKKGTRPTSRGKGKTIKKKAMYRQLRPAVFTNQRPQNAALSKVGRVEAVVGGVVWVHRPQQLGQLTKHNSYGTLGDSQE